MNGIVLDKVDATAFEVARLSPAKVRPDVAVECEHCGRDLGKLSAAEYMHKGYRVVLDQVQAGYCKACRWLHDGSVCPDCESELLPGRYLVVRVTCCGREAENLERAA